eukprot:gene21267-28188_t
MHTSYKVGALVSGQSATQQLLSEGCEALARLSLNAYGPRGRSKIVAASESAGAAVITSISARLLQGIALQDPLSKLVVQLTVLPQQKRFGDGGLLSLYLASRLISEALEFASSVAARLQVVAAYQLALTWIAEFLGQSYSDDNGDELSNTHMDGQGQQQQQQPRLCLHLQSSSIKSYVALTRSVISSKQVACGSMTQEETHILSIKIVQAFLGATPMHMGAVQQGPASSPGIPPGIKVITVTGLPPHESDLHKGCLLDLPLRPAVANMLPRHNVVIAIFEIPLVTTSNTADHSTDPPSSGSNLQVDMTGSSYAAGWSRASCELDALLALVTWLHEAGVQVVATQKLMHPSVQDAILACGMLPLQRLSAIHISSVAHVCGAVPLSSLQPSAAWKRLFGCVASIHLKTISHNKILLCLDAHGAKPNPIAQAPDYMRRLHPIHTLLLGCDTDLGGDELKEVVNCAFKLLSWSMQVPYALPGGGCAEALIAAHLRTRSSQELRQPNQIAAVHSMAAALEELAATLVPALPGDGPTILAAIREQAQHHLQLLTCTAAPAVQFMGWDNSLGQLCEVVECSWVEGNGPRCSSGSTTECQRQHKNSNTALVPGPAPRLLDLLAPKLGAISSGVEAACTLLKLDNVVRADGSKHMGQQQGMLPLALPA